MLTNIKIIFQHARKKFKLSHKDIKQAFLRQSHIPVSATKYSNSGTSETNILGTFSGFVRDADEDSFIGSFETNEYAQEFMAKCQAMQRIPIFGIEAEVLLGNDGKCTIKRITGVSVIGFEADNGGAA